MQKILITKEKAGLRLDKFLVREFFSFTRGELIQKIKEGLVTVNNKISKPSYTLKENDLINFSFSLEKEKQELLPNNKIKLNIIFEDENILAINKPAGIQVHPDLKEKTQTIVNGLVAILPEISQVHDNSPDSYLRPGIVHRLDKDTSGIMVVAKNKKTFLELKNLFQKRLITKKYLALVHGILKEKSGVIEKPLAKSSDYRKQIIANKKTKTKIRSAITNYHQVRAFKNFSLLEVEPKTGRMHQIRVHLASIGHPIVGDPLYLNKKTVSKNSLCPARQLLHAKELSFELFYQKYDFSAPTPPDFKEFLNNID